MSDFLAIQDDFDRLLSQTKAILYALTTNGDIDVLDKDIITDALWLVQDRLDDMARTYQKTVSMNQRCSA